MEHVIRGKHGVQRRSFLKGSVFGAGSAILSAALLPQGLAAADFHDGDGVPVTKGDIAILRFLSAVEQVEADLWVQYAELGGATNQGLSPIDLELDGRAILTGLAPDYITALEVLDGDMPQYIADNTDDEISHHRFLNNFLASVGGVPVDLSRFATLPPSKVTGVPQNGRLTNLQQLTVETTWWTRYRSATANPDFGGSFENAVPDLARGQHSAIPRSDGDLGLNADGTPTNHLQAIANTAGFHFAFIEQGGTSLYPALAQKVSNLEVLRILLSIGPSETMHFQTWQDKAGNALPLTDFDKINKSSVTFTALSAAQGETDPESLNGDTLQANLIMPEPTQFLDSQFGPVAIIRPTSTEEAGAVASFQSFVSDGLFIGQPKEFFQLFLGLAAEADAATREL